MRYPTTRNEGKSRQKGFTVADVVVGITVAGILLAIAAPGMAQTLRVYSLRGAAREIFSELQNARMAAVTQNNRYRFTLTDAQTYRVHDDDNSNGAEDGGEAMSDKDITANSQGVALAATGPVTFAANGTAPESATITLANAHGDTVNVAVSSAGRIRIQ